MEYSFGRHSSKLEGYNFDPEWFTANHRGATTIPVLKHLNFIVIIMEMLPDSWVAKVDPAIAGTVAHRNVCRGPVDLRGKWLIGFMEFFQQVDAIRLGKEASQISTIFHAILDSKLPVPDQEKTSKRMAAEAQTFIGSCYCGHNEPH
jgi:hypothetical protein